MAYVPPSVQVTSIANNRIINITEETRIPAFIGVGQSRFTVTDYPVVRSSGSNHDVLVPSGSSTISLTQVSPYPGASASYAAWHLAYGTSGSSGVYWGRGNGNTLTGTAGVNSPRRGEIYYVSYKYAVPSTQFDPQIFTDTKDIIATYGTESTTAAPLTVAANLALENGAPAVICVQVSGSSMTSNNFQNALNKLRKKSNVAYVVPVTTDGSFITSALTHCLQESSPLIGHERELIFGLDSSKASADSFISTATAYKNARAILVAPAARVTRRTSAGNTLTLNGSYVAAAFAGLVTGQDSPILPVTGKILSGLIIPDDQYEPYDMNRMAANGVTVLYSKSGVIKVRHALTTDPTSANTSEVSIVASDDLVRRITRNKLTDAYIGKGIVITPTTVADVAATVGSIWNSMVRQGLIASYGTKTDPTTGEVPVSASQDPNDPTKINVAGSVKFLYPLNFVTVEFFIFV